MNATPILTGATADAALAAALHVASKLADPNDVELAASAAAAQSQFPEYSHWFPGGIAQGNAGLVVLWAYLDMCFPEDGWDLIGRTHLELAVRSTEQVTAGVGLFSGLSGLAFAADHLSRGGTRYRGLLDSLDDAIATEAIALADALADRQGVSVGEFDVISGLSGVGAYLLSRHARPRIAPALSRTVHALTRLSLAETPVPAWHTPAALLYDDSARATYPNGNLNCGLAHGVPGILAFLALVRLTGLEFARLDEAIVTLGDWLSSHRFDDEWGVNWPTAVPLERVDAADDPRIREADPETVPGGPSRAAWCYGTPGVARALWLAGQAVHRQDYLDLASAGMHAVFARPIRERKIDSPTFCHGVAGLLAVALRFARETGTPAFVDNARALTSQLLAAFKPESRNGFRTLEFLGNETDQPGLLDGAAGIALVLLSASTGIEAAWDRLFLLA